MSACAECGAAETAGASCRECFEALLAFENEHPDAFGPVHHLTVACFFLQHPAGYTAEALDTWHALVADALDGAATPRELRRRSGQRFAGARRVRDAQARPPAWWPAQWPLTVRDVFRPTEPAPAVSEYVARAKRWADAVRRCLDAAALAQNHPGAAARRAASNAVTASTSDRVP